METGLFGLIELRVSSLAVSRPQPQYVKPFHSCRILSTGNFSIRALQSLEVFGKEVFPALEVGLSSMFGVHLLPFIQGKR
jgi:hypothetical protein